VFSGFYTAGAKLSVGDGRLVIAQEGKSRKFIEAVEHVTFSGDMARKRRQHITYVTERCVIDLVDDGLVVREIAPGVDLKRDILDLADFPLRVDPHLKQMEPALFRDAPMGLKLPEKQHV
jgi:acyl CoA:acetate/3-ketoacid CoA transferase